MTFLSRPARGAIAAATLCLSFTLAGCGGSDSDGSDGPGSDDTPSAAAITKADFVEQGNQICEDGNAALADALDGIDPNDPEAASTAITDQLVPNIQGQIDDLRALGYPEGDEQTLESIYTGAEDALDQISDDPSLMLTGSTVLDDTNTALVDYGLTTCGSSS